MNINSWTQQHAKYCQRKNPSKQINPNKTFPVYLYTRIGDTFTILKKLALV